MKVDPNTTVGNLLRAIPSSAVAFEVLGITVANQQEQTLERVCQQAGISFDKLLETLDGIDWEAETPLVRETRRHSSSDH